MILIHRDEARNGVATGRMAHLCLENSWLLEGTDFSEHEKVNELLADPSLYPVVLYPGPIATDLSLLSPGARAGLFPSGKRPLVFVIDGTWRNARKMRRLSRNLKDLPQWSFSPRRPSQFRVRKQPRMECLSTIEAIHEVIELFDGGASRADAGRPHDNLLDVFNSMVEMQVLFEEKNGGPAVRGTRNPAAHPRN